MQKYCKTTIPRHTIQQSSIPSRTPSECIESSRQDPVLKPPQVLSNPWLKPETLHEFGQGSAHSVRTLPGFAQGSPVIKVPPLTVTTMEPEEETEPSPELEAPPAPSANSLELDESSAESKTERGSCVPNEGTEHEQAPENVELEAVTTAKPAHDAARPLSPSPSRWKRAKYAATVLISSMTMLYIIVASSRAQYVVQVKNIRCVGTIYCFDRDDPAVYGHPYRDFVASQFGVFGGADYSTSTDLLFSCSALFDNHTGDCILTIPNCKNTPVFMNAVRVICIGCLYAIPLFCFPISRVIAARLTRKPSMWFATWLYTFPLVGLAPFFTSRYGSIETWMAGRRLYDLFWTPIASLFSAFFALLGAISIDNTGSTLYYAEIVIMVINFLNAFRVCFECHLLLNLRD